ncbi:MAG: MFS family permease [Rhodothermales bacterium]|jgi:MFS family permease
MSNERRVDVICGFGHFACHFFMLAFPALCLWMRKDLALSDADTINIGFYMYLFFGLFALPAGFISDRWNARSMLIIFCFGCGVCSLACGLSNSIGQLTVALAGVGAFSAIYHPVGMGMISKCCKNRGESLGRNGVFGGLGIALAPLAAGFLAQYIGWRQSYFIFALPCFAAGVWLLVTPIDETPVTRSSSATQDRVSSTVLYFALMLACMMLIGIVYRGTSVSLPTYFESAIASGVGTTAEGKPLLATLIVTGVYLLALSGQVVGGIIADRFDLRLGYVGFHLISVPAMYALGVWAGWPLGLAAAVYLFFGLGAQPIENSLVARLTPSHLRATSYGLKFIAVMGVGSLGVKLVRKIMSTHDTAAIFRIQSVLLLLVIVIMLLFCWLSRKHRYRNT